MRESLAESFGPSVGGQEGAPRRLGRPGVAQLCQGKGRTTRKCKKRETPNRSRRHGTRFEAVLSPVLCRASAGVALEHRDPLGLQIKPWALDLAGIRQSH